MIVSQEVEVSRRGEGAALPVVRARGELPTVFGVKLEQRREAANKSRALIVEDDPETADLIKLVLERAGLEAAVALDGYRAIEMCGELRPHIVLLDLMMPGLDGWETMRRLRRISDAPVVVVSAKGSKEDVIAGLSKGADDFVPKPFYPPELVARVKALLRRSSNSGGGALQLFDSQSVERGLSARP